MQRKARVAIIGAGNRGHEVYGQWVLAHPDKASVVAVADPKPERRSRTARAHGIPESLVYSHWEPLLKDRPDVAAVLVTTQDQAHVEPTVAALEAGYDVLLEKPMAATLCDLRRIRAAAQNSRGSLWVAHVLRYAPIFRALKDLVSQGAIGNVLSIQHAEHVAYWHFAHSYVRGPWSREESSTPIVLAKTCHDLDLLYWLVGSPAEAVHSFAERTMFHQANAPVGAPEFCVQGCPVQDRCLFYAPRLYERGYDITHIGTLTESRLLRWFTRRLLTRGPLVRMAATLSPRIKRYVHFRSWPTTAITDDLSDEGIRRALEVGPFGQCVYRSNNDVPDHQTVNIRFHNGVLATMTMEGSSYLDGRWFRVDGTEGTITGRFTYASQELLIARHGQGKPKRVFHRGLDAGGHSQADGELMKAFVASLSRSRPRSSSSNRHGNASAGAGSTATAVSAATAASVPTAASAATSRSANVGPHNLNQTSAEESLESHLMGLAAERSRHEKREVSLSELRTHLHHSI